MTIDPRGMGVIDWTDSMGFLVGSGTPTFRLDDPEEWREWGENLIGEPSQIGQDMPDPRDFDDWREWAMRFNQTIELTG